MDSITSLPKSKGNNCIIGVVYQFIKYAHLCYLYHYFKESTTIVAFMETIQNHHEIPNIVVRDEASFFTCNLWNEIFSCLGTQLSHISSYDHQYYVKIDNVNECH